MNQVDEFSGALPGGLLQRAYRAGGELAWARRDAIEAINGLTQAGFVIVGVEVWIPTHPSPTMTGWNWDCNSASVSGRPNSARDFVETFRWGSGDTALRNSDPFFNLTTA